MSFLKATLTALALVCQFTPALTAPTVHEGNMLSIRAADIANNDHSATEDHPLMGLYNRWLQTSPHASSLRRNASSVVERFPGFVSVDCYEDKNTCMLTSRMAMPEETVALARREAEFDHQRRGLDVLLGWDTDHLVAELHYKTYHWLGKEGHEEYAGFEQYVTWNWNCRTVLFQSTGGLMIADHKMEKLTNPSFLWVATLDTTVMDEEGPLKTESLIATFACAWIFGKPCCLTGGSEHVYIDGIEKNDGWAAPVERTCHYGKQNYDKCGA